MKIVITQEDCKNAPYDNAIGCPIALALNKALGIRTVFCWSTVSNLETTKQIGKIKPKFTSTEYRALLSGEITQFVTEYTPNT